MPAQRRSLRPKVIHVGLHLLVVVTARCRASVVVVTTTSCLYATPSLRELEAQLMAEPSANEERDDGNQNDQEQVRPHICSFEASGAAQARTGRAKVVGLANATKMSGMP